MKSRAEVAAVNFLPGDVLALHMKRPVDRSGKAFSYSAGQWIRICVPELSLWEWHPFTLSSDPNDELLELCIKNAGDWTGKLMTLFKDTSAVGVTERKIYIDGPYGAPVQDHGKYETVLLAAAGIGATPMVSIMRNLLSGGESACHRLYFHWVVRDAKAVSWFHDVLSRAVQRGTENGSKVIFDINIWYTGAAKSQKKVQASFLKLAQDVVINQQGKDFVSKIATDRLTVKFGRPDWEDELHDVSVDVGESRSPVGVFCCAPALMEEQLRYVCLRESGKKMKFDFRPEQF